jgi:hypothetical protein
MAPTRRSSRRVTGLALATATLLLLAGCGGGDDPTVAAPEEQPEPEQEPEPEPTPTEAPEADPDEPTDPEEPDDDTLEQDPPEEPEEPTTGPTPDPDALEDPCGPHAERTDEAFIEVVAPVAEQHVSAGAVELVGCSNVFEANVQWTLYDGDGRELDTGFTTAECGSGCVGAFATSVPLDGAAGEPFAELHVYAEDASGAVDRLYLTAIPLVLS